MNAIETLRGVAFLAFQVLVTPVYAALMLATFWLPIPVGGLSMRWLVARDLL